MVNVPARVVAGETDSQNASAVGRAGGGAFTVVVPVSGDRWAPVGLRDG